MRELLYSWAVRLLPFYNATLVVAALGALASAGLLLGLDNLHALAIRLSLLLTMWALTLFAFINLFRNPAPLLLPALHWRDRLLARLQLGLYYFMALAFCGLMSAVITLSVKLVLQE